MNKRILLSLATVGVALAAVSSATIAYFDDDATSTSNSFHSGTLDLKLSDEQSGSYTDSITGTFEASDMVPGGAGVSGKIWLENSGSVPADHVEITEVINTPSDEGVNEPECKAYGGEWKNGFSHGWCCVLPRSRVNTGTVCTNTYGGDWANTNSGDGYHCYAEDANGFKDDIGTWNDIDKYLEITSIKYAGAELKFHGGTSEVTNHPTDSRADKNSNGRLDLDDLALVAKNSEGTWLDDLTPVPGTGGSSPHSFEITTRLHTSAGSEYQTDKNGIKITFQLNQNSSQ